MNYPRTRLEWYRVLLGFERDHLTFMFQRQAEREAAALTSLEFSAALVWQAFCYAKGLQECVLPPGLLREYAAWNISQEADDGGLPLPLTEANMDYHDYLHIDAVVLKALDEIPSGDAKPIGYSATAQLLDAVFASQTSVTSAATATASWSRTSEGVEFTISATKSHSQPIDLTPAGVDAAFAMLAHRSASARKSIISERFKLRSPNFTKGQNESKYQVNSYLALIGMPHPIEIGRVDVNSF